MEDRKLGIAIHGAGEVARAHAASWMKNPHCEIVSVSSRRKESAQRLAEEAGLNCAVRDNYHEVLADDRVDVVNISGPNQVHAEQGIAAAQAGKHILIEKPMVLSMDENRQLRDAVEKAGVRSVVSFVLRWNPLLETLKSLITEGAIGNLFYAEVDYWHGLGPSWRGWQWAHTKENGGSTMLLGGCHALDAMRFFVGDEVTEVAAFGTNVRGNYEFDSSVVAIVKFRGGTIGKCATTFDCEMPYAFNVDLLGTDGSMRENRLWSKKIFPGQTDWTTMPTILPDSGDVHHHPFDAEINHLVDCIRNGRESHCNVADGYKTHELCIAIDRSMEQGGKPVQLPLD